MNHRQAASLVELLAIMSAATVVLSLTGVLLQRAMREQMVSRARVNAENASLRLADQFRHDVRNAREVHLIEPAVESGEFVKILCERDRSIVYSRKNGGIFRVESGGTTPVRHEQYDFPPGIEMNITRLPTPPRLSLTIELRASHASSEREQATRGPVVPVSLHVEPVIGQNMRFTVAGAPPAEPKP